jgi:sugar phosphate isomerase/epimerase
VVASFSGVHGPTGEGAPTTADVHAAVERLAAIGVRGVQWPGTTPSLRPRDLDSSARRGVRSLLDRLELVFTGIDLWIAPAHFLDRERIDRAIGAVDLAVRCAAEIAFVARRSSAEEPPIVSVLFPTRTELERSPLADQFRAARGDLLRTAERHGVVVADHEALSEASSAGVGVDPVVSFGAQVDPIAAVLAAGNRLASVRLVDFLRSGLRGPIGEPGEARLDVDALRATLDVVGWRGSVVVDARQWRTPLAGIEASLERWVGRAPAKAAVGRVNG